MKKQQKIIELRTAAKLKVAELQTKIAFARSEAAGKRARLMWERAAELDGLEAGSTERFDVLAKYRAKLSRVNEKMEVNVAQFKYEIQQAKAECEQQCAAAEDEPEPETEKGQPQPQQETVYCDGSEHSARIVARRLINKMPHVHRGGCLHINVLCDTCCDKQDYFVLVCYGNSLREEFEIFSAQRHTAELEAAFVEKARRLFTEEPESCNSHVAEPLSRALDAVFGGNPVEQVDNLISDTVKDGKESGNE